MNHEGREEHEIKRVFLLFVLFVCFVVSFLDVTDRAGESSGNGC